MAKSYGSYGSKSGSGSATLSKNSIYVRVRRVEAIRKLFIALNGMTLESGDCKILGVTIFSL
jgi:hypothetical protein